jgi:tetratricopeptide (TPR) repeat protein
MRKPPLPVLMKDFFISYNRADKAWAEWIAWQLEKADYSTILQAWDFRPGFNFVEEMQRATVEAERTIAVISPEYLLSEFARAEWDAAYVEDPLSKRGKLLPVKVRECELKGLRKPIVYIDLIGLDEEAAAEALIEGVSLERAKPAKEPAFPGRLQITPQDKPKFPGSLPEVNNLPLFRNPNFTGREQILADLRAALISGQPGSWKQAIWGMGGVGKSQIANEYVYLHIADYEVIWWVRSEDSLSLASDYAALASSLKLPEMSLQDQTQIIAAIKGWFEVNTGWLLIFDNAIQPQDIEGYLPRGGDGHIIITSRNPNWGRVAGSIEIKVFNLTESVQFLKKRTNQDDEAKELAKALGCLPLALEQAGAYIAEKAISLQDYIERFRKHQAKILEKGKPDGYPVEVAAAWDVSFKAVQEKSEVAADLFRLCSFLAPENIPRDLFSEGSKYLPDFLASAVRDDLKFDDIISDLRSYSLINADSENISIHGLVQLVTRDRMGEDDQRIWAKVAFDLLDGVFPNDSDDVRTWDMCSALLPHAMASVNYAEKMGVDITGHLLNQVGLYLWGQAEHIKAKSAFERALKIHENVLGPDHPNAATAVNNLGLVLQDMDDLEGAKEFYERALKIHENALGPDNPNAAMVANNLGMVLYAMGDLMDAKEHTERAIRIYENVLGPDHPNVAMGVGNLGKILQDMGDLKGAKELYERALKIHENALGPDHPDVATDINNLGMVLYATGDLMDAKEHTERAIRIYENALGLDHPYVAMAVNNLGAVLRAMGNLEGAKKCFNGALEIRRRCLGEDHPRTQDSRNWLESVK